MIKKYIACIVLSAILLTSALTYAFDGFMKYDALCTNVVDRDTIDLEIDMGLGMTLKDRARFLGFDAPETFRPKTEQEKMRGEAAKAFLKKLIENKEIIVTVPKDRYRGSFGRILIVPFHDNKNIILLMKEKGFEK